METITATTTPFLKAISESVIRSKLGRRLVDEARAMASAKRREAFGELQSVSKDGEAEIRRLAAAEAKASKAAMKAGAALVEAQRELLAASSARSGAAHQLDWKQKEREKEVSGLAPPELDLFLGFLQAVLDGLNTVSAPGYEGGRGQGVWEQVRAARARVEELRLSGETDADILKELRESRRIILKSFARLGGLPHELEVAADFESLPRGAA